MEVSSENRLHSELRLANPPIVEAVIDIDCDLPPTFELESIREEARIGLSDYPVLQNRLIAHAEFSIDSSTNTETLPIRRGLAGLVFAKGDERQLVQFRSQGYSFNRLAPYTTLDEYMEEIERTWKVFVKLAKPLQIRTVRLRNVNRILLPGTGGRVELNDYFRLGPRLTDEDRFMVGGFLHQHLLLDKQTRDRANVILTSQPFEEGNWPIIFDITAEADVALDPSDWRSVLAHITPLRDLKNHIFRNTITDKCLHLFR